MIKWLAPLLLSCTAFAQSAILLDSNSLPNLGAQISASGTFDVYGKEFQYKQDCTQITWANNEELGTATGTFDHYPQGDATGWGGYWCYATDNGSGPVAIRWPVAMGMKWYVNLFYMTADCSSRLPGTNPPQFGVQVTRTRSGVPEIMPQVEGTGPYRYAGFMRTMSYDTVDVKITLPDGKVLDFPHAFNIGGVPEVDDDAPYLVVEVNSDGSDSLCSVQTWNYMQKGMNNK